MLGMDQDPVPMCKEFVKIVIAFFLALYFVFKSMKSLSFDCLAETEIGRFPISTKVFFVYLSQELNIYIYISLLITPAGITQKHYITWGLREEERQENKEK